MSIMTLEGIVDQGQIRLKGRARLPDRTRVYVIVPDVQVEQVAQVFSPRLAHPEQIEDFRLQVIEENRDAGL